MPNRMVKVELNEVVQCIITEGLSPFINDGWQDVTNLFYESQPVSIGWRWNGIQFVPPPAPPPIPNPVNPIEP